MVKEKTKKIQETWKKFYEIAIKEREGNTRKFLFLYFSWMVFLFFLAFSFLAEKNPFSLLVPFNIFDLPKLDSRSEMTIFVSDGEDAVISSKRKVYLHKSTEERIREWVEEVGRPPLLSGISKENSQLSGSRLKKLPNLSIALVSIWIRPDSREVILDFSSSEILKELEMYRFVSKEFSDESEEEEEEDIDSYYSAPASFVDSKTQDLMAKKKEKILELTLDAIEKTIMENEKEFERIHFHLDGKRNVGSGIFSSFGGKK